MASAWANPLSKWPGIPIIKINSSPYLPTVTNNTVLEGEVASSGFQITQWVVGDKLDKVYFLAKVEAHNHPSATSPLFGSGYTSWWGDQRRG